SRLFGSQVGQPGREQASRVIEKAGGRRKYLNVTRPTQSLITLRAICREVEEIAAHTPDDVLMQPIHQRVGTLEPAGALHIRMADNCMNIARVQFTRPAVDLGIAEAMKRETRLPLLWP